MGTADGELEVRHAVTGAMLPTLTGFQGRLQSLFFSSDNRLLCAVGGNDTAKVWDLPSGKERCTFHARFSNGAFSLDGKRIITVGKTRVVRIWDSSNGRELRTHRDHRDIAMTATFSPNGQWVASGGWTGGLKLWRSRHGRERLEHSNWVFNAALSPNGKRVASASEDGIAKVWDIESGAQLQTLQGHFHGAIFGIDFSPDGDRIVTTARDKTARVWDADTGKELLVLRGHTRIFGPATFSPDGRRIATGGTGLNDPTKIWDAANGTELLTLEVQGEWLMRMAFSPDGKLIATTGRDRTIRLWDSESGKEIQLINTKGRIGAIAFSPDGERLVTAYSENLEGIGTPSMEIWELESGRELLSVKAHGDRIEGVAWSQSGDRIISASLDKTAGLVEVWESFPYRVEDYPGRPDSPLLERTQLYAAEYWRRRIAVENLTAIRPTPTPYSRAVIPPGDWFPSRDPNSGPEQLDLTDFYNALLNVYWHPTQRGSMWFDWDLSELPTGLVTLSNVVFDVRGVVQLADDQKVWQDHFETRVNGIKVGRKLKRLQILHGANKPNRTVSLSGQAASYVMHYADGSQVEFPILYGRDLLVMAWAPGMGMEENAKEATIVWRGMNPALKAWPMRDQNGILVKEKELRLFKSVWENPRPDEEIVSIDYVSAKSTYLLPFLIAITVEP